jgi:hypothetical protein
VAPATCRSNHFVRFGQRTDRRSIPDRKRVPGHGLPFPGRAGGWGTEAVDCKGLSPACKKDAVCEGFRVQTWITLIETQPDQGVSSEAFLRVPIPSFRENCHAAPRKKPPPIRDGWPDDLGGVQGVDAAGLEAVPDGLVAGVLPSRNVRDVPDPNLGQGHGWKATNQWKKRVENFLLEKASRPLIFSG